MQKADAKKNVHNFQKLIVLGAGDLTIKALTAWGAKKITLVEADSDTCEQLTNLIAENKEAGIEIDVQNIAIADKQEMRTFQHLNLSELSGFNIPEGLQSLYPGLKTQESQAMQTHSLQDFLASQALECATNIKNGLIIDIPTQLDELLKTLLESDLLSCFSDIQFTAISMPLSEDDKSIEYWLNQLQARGFELQNQTNLSDDFITCTVVKNPLFDRLQSLEQQLQLTKTHNQKLETQSNEMANTLDQQNQLIKTKDKELKDYQAWLSEARQSLVAESSTLNGQIEAVRKEKDELAKSKASLEQAIAEQIKQIERLTQERNHQQKLKDEEKAKLQSLNEQFADLQSNLRKTQDDLQSNQAWLNEAKEALVTESTTLKGQLETAHKEKVQLLSEKENAKTLADTFAKANEVLEAKHQALMSELSKVQKQLESLTAINQELQAEQTQVLPKVVEQLNSLQASSSKQLELVQRRVLDAMHKELANATKQVESFVSLQNYLTHQIQPLNFHGWPISPDIALLLIQKIEQNHYDFIIEFGSGTSTALLANVLKNKSTSNPNQTTKLITFEHNQKYFDQTMQALQGQQLNEFVDLTYAPLEEYAYKTEPYLYYSCNDKMAELSKALKGKKHHILVLVDGPPGATGPKARFPALPKLLHYFHKQKLDLVLDDYAREEEKAVANSWEQLLQERSIQFESSQVPSEKGLYFCEIN